MSEPFRDELAAAHEQLRRKDEEIARLQNEARMLEARLSFPQRPRAVSILVGIMLALTMVGAGAFTAMQRANMQKQAALEQQLSICMMLADPAKRGVLPKDRGETFPPKPKCNCQPGDPLCGCLP
jgi:hypothetical protein